MEIYISMIIGIFTGLFFGILAYKIGLKAAEYGSEGLGWLAFAFVLIAAACSIGSVIGGADSCPKCRKNAAIVSQQGEAGIVLEVDKENQDK